MIYRSVYHSVLTWLHGTTVWWPRGLTLGEGHGQPKVPVLNWLGNISAIQRGKAQGKPLWLCRLSLIVFPSDLIQSSPTHGLLDLEWFRSKWPLSKGAKVRELYRRLWKRADFRQQLKRKEKQSFCVFLIFSIPARKEAWGWNCAQYVAQCF